MMSTHTLPVVRSRSYARTDKTFYLVMAIASAALIVIGFSRSYYLRTYFPQTSALSLLVHVHGLVFSAWILYFVLQTTLIAVKRPSLHRKLGYTGVVLAVLMIVLGLLVSFSGLRLHHGTPFIDPETTFLVGLIDLFTFSLFFITGWIFRRDREAHQRLMLLAVIAGLTGPAIGRLVGFGAPIPAMAALNLAMLFAGPIYDLVTRRRIHRAYIFGCLFALATFTPFRFAVGATPAWHRIAHTMAGM